MIATPTKITYSNIFLQKELINNDEKNKQGRNCIVPFPPPPIIIFKLNFISNNFINKPEIINKNLLRLFFIYERFYILSKIFF